MANLENKKDVQALNEEELSQVTGGVGVDESTKILGIK